MFRKVTTLTSGGVCLATAWIATMGAPTPAHAAYNVQAATTAAVPAVPEPVQTIAKRTERFEKRDGFLPLYWDEKTGKIFLEIGLFDKDLLYITSLPTGIGSNEIGVDRGQIDGGRIVRFHRVGGRVLMIQPNLGFRADGASRDEKRAVDESFAPSALWSFHVDAEEQGRVLVDATDFALHDSHGVVQALVRQSAYRVDSDRSAVTWDNSRASPRNTEIEGMLTFAGSGGAAVSAVAATPESLTVSERQSFVALPEPGFKIRAADPRAGYFTQSYEDFTAPLGEPVTRRLQMRRRLEKKDPSAAMSDAVEPIVYYIDRGVPEPIRSALLEGASWWKPAFEAAGYRNAFRVELLPENADPMDIRYNVVEWVPRDVRGWSYGQTVVDPRTGEILKGHIILDARRVRYDYLLAEGLLSPYAGKSSPADMQKMVLARISQIVAHEIGHTLGLRHNLHASAQGRSSVMDYTAPLAELRQDGTVDLTNAYVVGVGDWDKVAIAYGYQDFPAGVDEKAQLDDILAQARKRNLTYFTDEDADGGTHPEVSRWDSGVEAAPELKRIMAVRRAALNHFGENAIRTGQPLATIEDALVPLYLFHRYQIAAVATALGGQRYANALRGDGQTATAPSPAAEQEKALSALLATLDPAELVLPRSLLSILPPRPSDYGATPEHFQRYTGRTFDAFAPAETAVDLTLAELLAPERAARMVEQHALDPKLPGFGLLLDRLIATVDPAPAGAGADAYPQEIRRLSRRLVAERLMDLTQNAPMPEVRALALLKIVSLRDRVRTAASTAKAATDEAERADRLLLVTDLDRFLTRPEDHPQIPVFHLNPPLGSPLGD